MPLRDLFSRKRTCDLLVNVEGRVVERYKHFKDFLHHNRDSLNLVARLEQTYHSGGPFSMGSVKRAYEELMQSTRSLIEALNGISRGKHPELSAVCDRIDQEVAHIFNPAPSPPAGDLVLPFEAISAHMVRSAGGKAANLATVGNVLGIPIPQGFVITAHAFERFLSEGGLARPIEEILAEITRK